MIAKVPIIGTGIPRKDPYRPAWTAPDWSVLIPSDAAGHPLTSDCLVWTSATSVPGVKAISRAEALAEFSTRDPKANRNLIDVVSPIGLLIPGLFAATKNPVSRRMILAVAVGLGIACVLPRWAWAGRKSIVSDNFNRADGGLGANWQGGYGTHSSLTIVSNRCRTSITSTEESDGSYIQTLGADQWMQATLAGWTANANVRDTWTMLRAVAAATETWYQSTQARNDTFTSNLEKRVAGVSTVIASENAVTWAAGDIVLPEVIGTSLTLSRNNASLLTATDSAITGTGRAGLGIYCATAANDAEWDDFFAGEYGGSLPLLGVG